MGYSNFSTVFDGKGSVARIYNDISSRDHHFDPNQPRVPAGNPEGGQWTAAGGYHGTYDRADDDSAVISDATPDNEWKPGAQYASRISRRGGSVGLPTPAQAARIEVARSEAQRAVRAVQEREPYWQPQQSVYSTVEGQVRALEARAQEAQARLQEQIRNGIGPGPYGFNSFPARGPTRKLRAGEREQNNRNGDKNGCHTCGTKDPGTSSGAWIGDHQGANKLIEFFGGLQRIFPHCASCSGRQGAWIAHWINRMKEYMR